MNAFDAVRGDLATIGLLLRRPSSFAERFRDQPGERSPRTFPALLAAAAVGLAGFGLTLDLHHGAAGMLLAALRLLLAFGFAWVLSLPALYILGSVTGSRLDWPSTALAGLLAVCFGSLALLAGAPIQWFFAVAFHREWAERAIGVVILLGTGIAMFDVFLRAFRALEPDRLRLVPALWLGLVCLLGAQLARLFHLF